MKLFFRCFLVTLFFVSCSSDDSGGSASSNCNAVTAIGQSNIEVDSATLQWSQDGATSFTIEYGTAGFSLGSGSQLTATSRQAVLSGLDQNTTYDYYVRANCDGTSAEFSGPATFTTMVCPAATIDQVQLGQNSVFVSWFVPGAATEFDIEYGLSGFAEGTGTQFSTQNSSITIDGLLPETSYDVYVRTNCGTTSSDDGSKVIFTTEPNCATPTDFSGSPTTAGAVELFWNPEGETAWRLEYGLSGFELGTGTELNTSQTYVSISGLQSGTLYEFYLQSNCGSNGLGTILGPLPLVTN